MSSSAVVDWGGKGSCFGELRNAYVAARSGRPEALTRDLSAFVSDGPILDVGTGTGISARELAEANPGCEVFGYDHDPLMLEAAKEKEVGVLDRRQIQYLPGEVENLAETHPEFRGRFSLVTAMSCFHWFQQDVALQQISQILKPNGCFAVISGNGDGVSQRILSEVVGHIISHPIVGKVPEALFVKNGYAVVHERTYELQETMKVEKAVQRVHSSSYWQDVVVSHKEDEADERLTRYFQGLANKEGWLTRTKICNLQVVRIIR